MQPMAKTRKRAIQNSGSNSHHEPSISNTVMRNVHSSMARIQHRAPSVGCLDDQRHDNQLPFGSKSQITRQSYQPANGHGYHSSKKLTHFCKASGVFPNYNNMFTKLRVQEIMRLLSHRSSDCHLLHPLVLSSSTSCFYHITLSHLTL